MVLMLHNIGLSFLKLVLKLDVASMTGRDVYRRHGMFLFLAKENNQTHFNQ